MSYFEWECLVGLFLWHKTYSPAIVLSLGNHGSLGKTFNFIGHIHSYYMAIYLAICQDWKNCGLALLLTTGISFGANQAKNICILNSFNLHNYIVKYFLIPSTYLQWLCVCCVVCVCVCACVCVHIITIEFYILVWWQAVFWYAA